MRPVALVTAAVVGLAVLAAPALGHGGEDKALEQTPARALAQQALALLSQKGKATESHERVEAALESDDTEGVDLAALRKTQRAFNRGDHDEAERLLGAALAPKETAAVRKEEEKKGHAKGGEARGGVADEALEHQPEFEPERDNSGWIGLGAGIAALLLGSAGLMRARRPKRA